jgi:hypothetical protein
LIGDRRTAATFEGTLRGILISGSLICARIAAAVPEWSDRKRAEQRVIRMAKGESTQRSQLDGEHLLEVLRGEAVRELEELEADGLWLILDGSAVRKPHAQAMPDLMRVPALTGGTVPGYGTMNVLGMVPGWRRVLYHRLYTSREEGFLSEPAEAHLAIRTVSEAVSSLSNPATWLLDRGFDDVAIWRTIWEHDGHLVCRLGHLNRRVELGDGQVGSIEQALAGLQPRGRFQAEMTVRLGRQKRPKSQRVLVDLSAVPIQLHYDPDVRREAEGHREPLTRHLWLVRVQVLASAQEPWLLLTDWPVETAPQAELIFRMYAARWSVEDSFRFIKDTLGWEDVQLLDLHGIRTLLALAWVVAAYLYELGVSLDEPTLQIVARLGGWSQRPDRPPGKLVLSRGLRRLLDMLATKAFLDTYRATHGPLPDQLLSILDLPPGSEL